MLIKNIKTILIILLFFCSIIYAKEKKYNEKTYIRNEEEAKAAYSLALFYKERALASKIPTEESIEDLEKAKVILKEVLKYINNNEINITLAETHEALGEYDESSAIYDKLISENPDDVYLLIKAAERNIFLMGDYGKAKYYLDSAYEIDSFNNDILILLGFIYYSGRDFEKAVLYFEKVEPSKGASNNYMQYYNYYYGMSEFYLSRFKKALSRLKEVNIKGLNPVDRYNTLYGIIKSYQALENYKEAYSNSLATKDASELSLFLSFMADDHNEELFSEIDMSDAPKILSIILTAKNEGYSNALNIIETGLDRRDIDLDIIQTYYKLINEVGDIEDKINAEMDTISFYVALKNIDALPNHIDKLIEYDKTEKFNNLYLQAAAEFRNQNDFESAKEMLNKYISLTNKAILENELVSLVLTAIDIKEYDLALNSINKFEKEKYSYSYLRAYVNLHKNEIEKANQFLNEDLIYFRNNKSNTNEYRLNIPYITAMSISNTNSVMEYVNFIYSSNTNSANNINSMAWVLVYLEIDIDRGIELAKSAIKKESKSPHYLDTLGFGYYKKKNYDGALKQLLKAALYVDDNSKAEIYLHIADAYYDKNDLKNALKYYRKSISSLYKDFIFINFEEDRVKKRIEFINNKLKN
ncbi:tetratricopeptide repeat protein [Brachyspira aalborgi]|uniref:Tetratricopeptide repeat protein n=1 Tax=Brachyspira aalborgi TaxID=29522 RepID=A0A5C8FK97_9SPIR|nr:tetratricopeptide repeat protein [Brachyspira aalborgi]TXJ36916.1 tetratricopeptide repeat protein [Brachyspira aalborgi]TXJ50119.1 tetratricopeptide repeat protein [Brachyspira aalborgi]